MKHLSPAEYVIHIFKGVRATARVLGRGPTTVSKWRKAKDLGGRGGELPRPVMRRILEEAQARGLDITPSDLILGRAVESHGGEA